MLTQQGRGQALYSTMWGLGVAAGSLLAGKYWTDISGESVFMIAGLAVLMGLLFVTALPNQVQKSI